MPIKVENPLFLADALLRTLEKENPNENVKEITLKEYLDALPMVIVNH